MSDSPYRIDPDSNGEPPIVARPAPRGWRQILLRNTRYRQVAVLALDGMVAMVALWLAMELRFEGAVPAPYLHMLPPLAALLALSRIAGRGLGPPPLRRPGSLRCAHHDDPCRHPEPKYAAARRSDERGN